MYEIRSTLEDVTARLATYARGYQKNTSMH